MHVQYPMMFRLAVPGGGGRATHCGVQEFSSEEGRAYLPHWMMANLGVAEGAMLSLRNVTLPKARFVKIRPHSVDFLELKNPRAMLEGILRGYAALTVGDVICLHYAGTTYEFDVLEAKPAVRVGGGGGGGGGVSPLSAPRGSSRPVTARVRVDRPAARACTAHARAPPALAPPLR